MEEKPENYFEGILQLRDPTQEIVDYVEDRCGMEHHKMVAKAIKVKGGFDFYLQSNNFLKRLIKDLEQKFYGESKLTYTLHTRKDNKDLYRITALFRKAEFVKGDILLIRGDELELIGVAGKVMLKNVKTGKKVRYTFDELRKLKARKI